MRKEEETMKFADMIKSFAVKAYAARTLSEDPLQGFMFRLSIPGLPAGLGFTSVGDFSREVEVVEYLENIYNCTHKLPGRETVSELTFSRGMYADAYLESIYKTVFNNNRLRQTVTLNICDRFSNVRRTFQFAEAWFSSYNVSGLDASSSDVIVEELTMQFEHFL